MDEARRVLDRLDRIDELREAGSGRAALLPELRALMREGERWVASEGGEASAAAAALSRLDERLAVGSQDAPRELPVAAGLRDRPARPVETLGVRGGDGSTGNARGAGNVRVADSV